jgi:hypothetical protein
MKYLQQKRFQKVKNTSGGRCDRTNKRNKQSLQISGRSGFRELITLKSENIETLLFQTGISID